MAASVRNVNNSVATAKGDKSVTLFPESALEHAQTAGQGADATLAHIYISIYHMLVIDKTSLNERNMILNK